MSSSIARRERVFPSWESGLGRKSELEVCKRVFLLMCVGRAAPSAGCRALVKWSARHGGSGLMPALRSGAKPGGLGLIDPAPPFAL